MPGEYRNQYRQKRERPTVTGKAPGKISRDDERESERPASQRLIREWPPRTPERRK